MESNEQQSNKLLKKEAIKNQPITIKKLRTSHTIFPIITT